MSVRDVLGFIRGDDEQAAAHAAGQTLSFNSLAPCIDDENEVSGWTVCDEDEDEDDNFNFF